MTSVPFSFRRTLLIAGETWREAIRQKLFNFIVLLALGLVMGGNCLRDFNFGAPELKFIADVGDGTIAFFGAALTIVATAQLFCSEIEHRTALTLLAKAVWRTEFMVGKFLGVAALTAGFCILLSVTLAVVLGLRESALMRAFPEIFVDGNTVSYGALALAGWLQWLKLAMLGAGTLLVASFAQTQIYTVMTGFAIFVICHLQGLVHGRGLFFRAAGRLIGWIFPDFQAFSTGVETNVSWLQFTQLSVYAFGHIAVACALAVYFFRRREI